MSSLSLFQRIVIRCGLTSCRSMEKQPVKIMVTGAAGQIGYALVPMIARGVMLGSDQPVFLHLLDIPPAAEALNGVKMELIDAAFPLLKGVVATTNLEEACGGVNIAIMVGGFRRKEGTERKDVMSKNASIYKAQASALEQYAAANCKVLVVANPANTNALILKEFAPSIPAKNITCLTRLDHNRALGGIAQRLNIHVSDVKNVIIWGNHSSTQYPDANHATVITQAGEKSVKELVADDKWLHDEFISFVQQRGAAIIKARKLSSALSAASAACDHIHNWVLGTPKGTWTSMGVYSDGSYGVPPGLIYSFPVTCNKGEWSIVQAQLVQKLQACASMSLHELEWMRQRRSSLKRRLWLILSLTDLVRLTTDTSARTQFQSMTSMLSKTFSQTNWFYEYNNSNSLNDLSIIVKASPVVSIGVELLSNDSASLWEAHNTYWAI